MKLFAVMNKDVPFGKALNALAHVVIGLGTRISGTPDIFVAFATESQIRRFRQDVVAVSKRENSDGEQFLFSDFTDSMTGETAREQLVNTAKTNEKDLNYYAVCCLGENSCFYSLAKNIGALEVFKDYSPFLADDAAAKLVIGKRVNFDLSSDSIPDNKMVMVLDKKPSIPVLLNSAVLACLKVGQNADNKALCLLNFRDMDGNDHDGISYHPFPILSARSHPKLKNILSSLAEKSLDGKNGLINANEKSPCDGKMVVGVSFGGVSLLDSIIPRNQTSLFRGTIDAQNFRGLVNTSFLNKLENKSSISFNSNSSNSFFYDPTIEVNTNTSEAVVDTEVSSSSPSVHKHGK